MVGNASDILKRLKDRHSKSDFYKSIDHQRDIEKKLRNVLITVKIENSEEILKISSELERIGVTDIVSYPQLPAICGKVDYLLFDNIERINGVRSVHAINWSYITDNTINIRDYDNYILVEFSEFGEDGNSGPLYYQSEEETPCVINNIIIDNIDVDLMDIKKITSYYVDENVIDYEFELFNAVKFAEKYLARVPYVLQYFEKD